MKRLFSKLAVMSLTAIFSCSCVNPDYDLSQGLELDMVLLPNTAVPVGNVEPVSISTLLGDANSSSSMMSIDEAGNMTLSFGNDTLTQTFTMPEVNLGGEGGFDFSDEASVDFVPKFKGINFGGLSYDQIPEDIPDEVYYTDTDESDGDVIRRSFKVDIHKEIPEQIVDIDLVTLEAKIVYNFAVSEGSVLHVKKGFMIEFPEFMVIEKDADAAGYEIDEENPHIIVFRNDITITDDNPMMFKVDFNRMNIPSGSVTEELDEEWEKMKRYITLEGYSIDAAGDIYLSPSDYRGRPIPEILTLNMSIELEELEMKSAHVMLDMDLEIDDKKFSIGTLPDVFAGEDATVDLYNPMLRFALDNDSPFIMQLNADITSYTGSDVVDIHIGDCSVFGENHEHATDPVVIPAHGKSEYYFSRRGAHEATGGDDIELDKLGDIIKQVPDSIVIHDIKVITDKRFVDIFANEECHVDMNYEFLCPLAFGEDLDLSFTYDINLGLETETMGIDSLLISMNMINTIPLDFQIEGLALDNDGNEIKGASVDLDLDLAAGTLDEPSESPVEVVVCANNDEVAVGMLRLLLRATSSETMAGKVLNTSQGLGINDICVILPSGVNLDLTEDKE